MSGWEINFKENKQVWDVFVSTSPQRSVFVFSKFLDSLQADYDLVTCYEKNKIVAGAVLIYTEGGAPIDAPFPFTQYQGVLLADNAGQLAHSRITHDFKVVEYFVSRLVDHYRKFCLCHSWRLNDLRPFQWYNYHEPEKGQFNVGLRYTAVMNLHQYDDFESYLASIRLCRKQEFRKASRMLRFEYSDNDAMLDVLHAKTFQRQNLERSKQESVLVRSICRCAIAGDYGKMSVAFLDEEPVSAVLFLYDDRTAYYLFAANDPHYRNTGAGSFLMLSMIRDAIARGISEIDFVGANSPNRGDFKISFNADLKHYFVTKLLLVDEL